MPYTMTPRIMGMAILILSHMYSSQAVNLRTTSLVIYDAQEEPQAGEPHQDDVESALQALTEDPAGLCSIMDLVAGSVNAVVDSSTEGLVPVGSRVELKCKPGTVPASQTTTSAYCQSSEGDANAAWSSFLSCGSSCTNSELASASGSPLTSSGTTAPHGIMKMKCSSWSQDVVVTCSLDGTWSNTEPCKMCDTTELTALASKPVLSVSGLVAPWSRVQLSCQDGQFAHPSARAAATCEPGGTWHVPPFQCQSVGCTTDDFMPGEVDSAAQGLLAVGSTVLIQRFVKEENTSSMIHLLSTCTSTGSWSVLEPTSADRR